MPYQRIRQERSALDPNRQSENHMGTAETDLDADDFAERYAAVGDEGRFRVREDPAVDVHEWLREQVQGIREAEYLAGMPYVDMEQAWASLTVVLLAAIPDDQRWLKLTDWLHGEYDDSEDVDEVAIQRAMSGFRARLNPAETREAVRRLSEAGLRREEICTRLRLNMHQVKRHLSNYRTAEQHEVHQREVERLIGEGLTVRQVAERLGISPRAVTNHKTQLRRTEGKAA